MAPLTLAEVNALDPASFVAMFGGIVEHSPWVAERVVVARPFADREALVGAFHEALRAADEPTRRQVVEAHPDLGGKLAQRGALTAASAAEQHGAGLDLLTEAERVMFTELNEAYRTKFGFPFVFAVKGSTKDDVLRAFEDRLPNAVGVELANAVEEIALIARFRLHDLVRQEG
ncbi:MAG: 2-oxo-4-hydroxy-4-carboxy-5-ureidoimidazoline decarboxylase [Pseudomonadota bacterium]